MESVNWKRNLFCVWLGQILSLAGYSAIIPFIPLFIRDRYQITDEKELGLRVAALTFFGFSSFCISTPFWGIMADRFGRKLMLLRSYYACALLFPLLYFAPSVTWLIVMRFIASCFSGSETAAQTLIVSTTPEQHHGFALGTLSTAVWSGNMIGFLAGSLFVHSFGYFWGFMGCGAMYLTGGIITHIMVREHFVPPPKTKGNRTFFSGFKGLSAAVWVILILFICLGLARRLDEPYISLLVSRTGQPDRAVFHTGLICLTAALGGLLSGIVMGKLCDRFAPTRIAVPAVFAAAATMVIQALAGNLWLLGGARFIHFSAAGGLEPAFQSLLSRISPPDRRGSLFGLASSLRMFGILLASLLGGGIIYVFGTVRAVFLGSGVLFLALLPLIFKAAADIRKMNCDLMKVGCKAE